MWAAFQDLLLLSINTKAMITDKVLRLDGPTRFHEKVLHLVFLPLTRVRFPVQSTVGQCQILISPAQSHVATVAGRTGCWDTQRQGWLWARSVCSMRALW